MEPVTDEFWAPLGDGAGAGMRVSFERDGREVIDYAVVLVFSAGKTTATVRVYDSAHGFNEMHRYTRGAGKQTGMPFHSGSLGEGLRAAMKDVQTGYGSMIEGWER